MSCTLWSLSKPSNTPNLYFEGKAPDFRWLCGDLTQLAVRRGEGRSRQLGFEMGESGKRDEGVGVGGGNLFSVDGKRNKTQLKRWKHANMLKYLSNHQHSSMDAKKFASGNTVGMLASCKGSPLWLKLFLNHQTLHMRAHEIGSGGKCTVKSCIQNLT